MIARLACLCALLGAPLASAADAELPDSVGFFRQMELRVPHTSATLVADGGVTDTERAACATTRQFITFEADARGDDRTTARLAHNGSRLYLAVEITTPAGKEPRARGTKRDDTALWKSDDAVEVMITIGKQSFDFVGNAAGVRGDYRIAPKDMAWDHDGWQYAATRTEGGWQAEFVFSASVFGVNAFGPRIACQVDVVNYAKRSYISGLAFRGGAWLANKEFYP